MVAIFNAPGTGLSLHNGSKQHILTPNATLDLLIFEINRFFIQINLFIGVLIK